MPKVKVKVPPLSGFDKSFQNLLTTKVGTLTPLMCDEVIPNTRVHLKVALSASLPPLASDTFMRCNLKCEAFFVPSRLLYGGFESWITGQKVYNASAGEELAVKIPVLNVNLNDDIQRDLIGPGTLADFLGYRGFKSKLDSTVPLNIFPFLAYHRIYDDWFRNPLVQSPLFYRPDSQMTGSYDDLSYIPYVCSSVPHLYYISSSFASDGTSLGDLRQRNFGVDYFTSAFPNPQVGDAQRVKINLPQGATETSFTIASLRAANSLQQFAERNEMAGPRLQDFVRANYGADLSSGVAQRTIYLGSGEVPVYSKGIYQNASSSSPASSRNPFNSVAAEYGSISCNGEITLIEDFTAAEPGYIFVMCSLVPVVTYSSGINRMLLRYNAQDSQVDMASPLLQNVGFDPIYTAELSATDWDQTEGNVFGYTDRYASFKTRYDELHGLLLDGQSLEAFALQRNVFGNPTIDSDFLAIPQNYLDQVSAVDGSISSYGLWLDSYIDYKVSMPLAEFAIPSLQDPAYEHGHDVEIELGGSRVK